MNEPADHGREPTEEELRAAYEAQLKQIRVEQILLENVVTLINLGMRRTGLAPGTEGERDVAQVQLAIESVRALLPLIEPSVPQQVGPIRDAVSQLQLAFVKIGGDAAAEAAPPGAPAPDSSQPQGAESGAQQAATGGGKQPGRNRGPRSPGHACSCSPATRPRRRAARRRRDRIRPRAHRLDSPTLQDRAGDRPSANR